MRSFSRIFLLSLVSILFFQCQKEIGYTGQPDNQPVLPEPITATLQGKVIDETGQPAAGVSINVGAKSATTDAKGNFRIAGASLDKKTALVTAQKSGYFKAYRSFSATSGANMVKIKLVKRALAGTVDAATGGEASLSNGSKVALPAAGVVNASTGAAYTGAVKVYAAYIDPSAADIAETVPGSFTANDKDGKRVTLTSYGMLAVELEGASGEKLQVKSGAAATLTTAIPSATLASAPATIPMWYVDETTGVWKEEGSATKTGNTYVGQVAHFSFWNCDVSASAVTLTVNLTNADGLPLANAKVRITRASQTWAVYGWTDSLGRVSGYVPNAEALVLDVLNQCNSSIYTQNIAALSQNTTLPTIVIGSTNTSIVTIKGKIVSCASAPVTNGFALITYEGQAYYAGTNTAGEFQLLVTTCSGGVSSFEVTPIDNAALQQGSVSTMTVTTPTTNTGTLSACGVSATQYINYTLDGTNYSIVNTNANDSLVAYTQDSSGVGTKTTYLVGFQIVGDNGVTLSFRSNQAIAGTYTATQADANLFQQTTPIQPFNVIVTNFPATPGGFYEGSFSGTFTDASGPGTHTLSGTFRVRRAQ
jgi:hypothetical protein